MLKAGFLRFCDNPEIACCKAERELEHLRSENALLRKRLSESQRRERAALEDMKFGPCCVTCANSRITGLRGVCALGGKESCNDGVHGYKKWQWRGPQEAGKGEAG